jgi:photosystem II stability/assembly factor-like uncharacterized protein
MTNRPAPNSTRGLVAAALVCLLCCPVWAGGTDYSMLMKKAETSLLLDIASAGERLVAVGERGHILSSNDGGANWVQARVPTSVMLTRVFFASPQLGWAVGHDGNILVSRDGGINWELQRDGVSDQARINDERAGRAKSELNALREQLSTVTDEARESLLLAVEEAEAALDLARIILDEPVYAPPLMGVWFANEEQGWASGAYGTLLYTANGGRHWDDWSHKVDNPDELHLNGVAGGADGSVYLASEWGYVFRSDSGGENWQPVETGYEGSFFGMLTNPATHSVFAYGLLGTIYRSTDGGETWKELRSMARASLFGADVDDAGTLVFVGQGGTAVQSQDDGQSFTALPQSSRRGLHGIALTPEGYYIVAGEGGSSPLATPGRSAATPEQ